jgi:multidrug efflux system membrane fusion protein
MAQMHQRVVKLYGQTEALHDVHLQAQTAGEVTEIVAAEGSFLNKGDVILRIDPRERAHELEQAKAQMRQREIEYEAARKLKRSGYQSEINLAGASSALAAAKANLKRVELDVSYTEMKAPFDGVLDRVNVDPGDFIGVGVFGVEGAVARMVAQDPMRISGYVSQTDRAGLTVGSPVEVALPDGRHVSGTLVTVASAAEEASRTFRVEAEVPNPDGKIAAGLTAELMIPAEADAAYFVAPSVLALNDAGEAGVKALDAENRVVFYPVKMLEDEPDGMWISGPPSQMRLITQGQAWVSPGQEIPAERVAAPADEGQP